MERKQPIHIVITHPDFDDWGGVSAYFAKLKNCFAQPVTHFIVGRRPTESGWWRRVIRFAQDNLRFRRLLRTSDIQLVHLNPSLGWLSIFRDGLFLRMAHWYGVPVLVFFHGWNPGRSRLIERRFLWLFRFLFGHAAAFIVLADSFKETMERWGFSQVIYRETMVISDDDLEEADIEKLLGERRLAERWEILFLARVIVSKGIYEALDTTALLKAGFPDIGMVVAGDGSELRNARAYAERSGLPEVRFSGYVSGQDKKTILRQAHLFLLPSLHGEGFPNTLVEAMAYGLPVVTRSVGGIRDFFQDGKHGFITDSRDPEVLAELIARLYRDRELYARISRNNAAYARLHFSATAAVRRLEDIYRGIGGQDKEDNNDIRKTE